MSPKIVLADELNSAEIEFYLWEIVSVASGRALLIGGRYFWPPQFRVRAMDVPVAGAAG